MADNELAAIQAMVAQLEEAPPAPQTQHVTEDDLADVADVLETVQPDAAEGDEGDTAAAVKTVAAVLEEEDDVIEKLLKAHQEKRGGVHEAQTKAAQIVANAEAKAAEVLRKAEESLQQRAQALLTSMLQDPMAAAQEFRVDPDAVIRATAEASDPQAKGFREMRFELQKRDRELGELRGLVQKLVSDRETETRQQQQERWNRAQEKFLADADKDNFPAVNLFWGKKRFLGEAYEESQAIREAAEVLGGRPEITDKQIVQRLERRAREELRAVAKDLVALVAQLDKTAPLKPEKKEEKEAPPAKGKGPAKTLAPSASAASTKGVSPAKRKFKSDAEEHAYLVKVAQEILNKQSARTKKTG